MMWKLPFGLSSKLLLQVAYLEGNINRFAEAVEASEGVSLANSVHVPSQVGANTLASCQNMIRFHRDHLTSFLLMQEPLWYVGRICCDSEGKLNENSLLLEGSIRHSQASHITLIDMKSSCYNDAVEVIE